MNIFGIGLPEMALILVIALLVFGPKKLPEIGRSLAQALGSFKKAQQEFETELKRETAELENSLKTPMKAEIERPDPKALPEDQLTAVANDADGESTEGASISQTAAEEPVSDVPTTSAQ
ncbi:MAG: TatA/E family twin arginine-targeting protein translocase [Cyanobacteria bacterium P01_C01_bin.120]